MSAFVFDAESEQAIAAAISKYPQGKQASAVMPLLYIAQAQMKREQDSGWVPRAAMDEIARRLSLAPIRVYEVATFYLMFNTAPVGKYHLQVCTTTPCWLRGSDDVVVACQRVTGIENFGDSSADGLFTLTEVECLGACVNAPMLQINDDYFEDLNTERTETLLRALQAGKALPHAGPTNGRPSSAPATGQTTLLQDAPNA
jgi:NADH-quinone oxidoreductase subunit E